ncbi:hypothetical protein QR680_014608 [Steinernema hermaphroditum]|uniref:Uncharacterized protein n=1 Tax=Steinernema hermaphroditum TaxID=289476 RepID=A0AA39I9H9_9BILA|nr:hypothetical protein QR680_014608 [Steinernema hermaphroditum]
MASQLVHLIEPVISLLATLIGIISMTYFIWESRKTARNYIKLAYFGVALYTGITNLANIIFWMVSISTQSFIPQLLTFLDFFEFTSLRLLRSVALGATFIKLKTSHSWCYTPSLLRSICLFILLSWITVSFSYIATLALDQKEVRWNCSRPCCFFYGHHLLSKCKIAVDIVYSLLLAALICVSVAKSAKTSPEEVMKGWSEEKVEFFVLNNRLYSIYLPCLLLLVGQELVIQCILSFREIKDKSAAELLDGYERIVRSLEPVLLANQTFCSNLSGHWSRRVQHQSEDTSTFMAKNQSDGREHGKFMFDIPSTASDLPDP